MPAGAGTPVPPARLDALTPARHRGAAPSGAGLLRAVRAHPGLLLAVAVASVLVATVAGVAVGSVGIGPVETAGIIARRLLGLSVPITWSPAAETIVVDLRLPRVLTALVVGAALSVAGVTLQGLLRNPLADPYVLGTASGAALGASLAVLLPVRVAVLGLGLVHVLAFAGALAAVWVVHRLSRASGLAPLTGLLLTGYAVSSLLAAGLLVSMYLAGANLRRIFFYLLGGFSNSSWDHLLVAAPIALAGGTLLFLRARALDALLLGEEAAHHLGLDVRRERAWLLGLASLVTAAAVAVGGLIGFVGLVVPHVVRLLTGPDARRLLPASALFGAAFLALADVVARVPGELPVGIVTALVGAPFFLWLLRRARGAYAG